MDDYFFIKTCTNIQHVYYYGKGCLASMVVLKSTTERSSDQLQRNVTFCRKFLDG